MFNSMFDELKELKHFQEIKDFKGLIVTSSNVKYVKEVYSEPKRASTTELFCEYTEQRIIFAIKELLSMFD